MRIWWQLTRSWLKAHRSLALLALLLALSTVFAGIGLLAVAGWFLTGAFLAGSTLFFNLFAPSALVRGLSMWRIASRYAERVVGHHVTLGVQAQLRTESFSRLASYTPAQLAAYRDGDLVARLIGDIERLDLVFLLLIAPAFTALVAGATISLVMGAILPSFGWLALLVLFLASAVLPYLLAKRTAIVGRKAQQLQADLRALTHDAISSHIDVSVYQLTATVLARFEQLSTQLAQAQLRVARAASLGALGQQLLLGLWLMALLWFGVLHYVAEQLSAPVWVALLLGSMGLFEVISPLMKGAANLGAVQAAGQRLQQLTEVSQSAHTKPKTRAMPSSGCLTLSAVSVYYEQQCVLDQLDLVVKAGEHIAIQGPSGIGKTTLLMAIMQVHAPQSGRIQLDDVDLAQVPLIDLYRHISLLSQHSPIFMGTVRHNLLLAKPQASDDDLWAVLKQVRLDTQIRELGGLDTWVGEGGNTLSTGQVRRLSLARTILADAPIWLLDEPTAGLDQATAHAWFADLRHLARGRTVVVVTHADLAANTVDKVYYLQAGKLQLL